MLVFSTYLWNEWMSELMNEWQGKQGQFENFHFKQPLSNSVLVRGWKGIEASKKRKGLHIRKNTLLCYFPFIFLTYGWKTTGNLKNNSRVNVICTFHHVKPVSVRFLGNAQVVRWFVCSDNCKCLGRKAVRVWTHHMSHADRKDPSAGCSRAYTECKQLFPSVLYSASPSFVLEIVVGFLHRVTNSFQIAWNWPGFSLESPTSRETPQFRAPEWLATPVSKKHHGKFAEWPEKLIF